MLVPLHNRHIGKQCSIKHSGSHLADTAANAHNRAAAAEHIGLFIATALGALTYNFIKGKGLSRLDHGAVNGLAGNAQIGGAVLIVHILGRIAGIQVGVAGAGHLAVTAVVRLVGKGQVRPHLGIVCAALFDFLDGSGSGRGLGDLHRLNALFHLLICAVTHFIAGAGHLVPPDLQIRAGLGHALHGHGGWTGAGIQYRAKGTGVGAVLFAAGSNLEVVFFTGRQLADFGLGAADSGNLAVIAVCRGRLIHPIHGSAGYLLPVHGNGGGGPAGGHTGHPTGQNLKAAAHRAGIIAGAGQLHLGGAAGGIGAVLHLVILPLYQGNIVILHLHRGAQSLAGVGSRSVLQGHCAVPQVHGGRFLSLCRKGRHRTQGAGNEHQQAQGQAKQFFHKNSPLFCYFFCP